MPISGKTLLHLVRQTPLPPIDPPRVVGIDNWAWPRGHRYGTIICDLERHQLVALLPDRGGDGRRLVARAAADRFIRFAQINNQRPLRRSQPLGALQEEHCHLSWRWRRVARASFAIDARALANWQP